MKNLHFFNAFMVLLLTAGCAGDMSKREVPEFEISRIDLETPSGSFLSDSHYLMRWDILGPVSAAKDASLHTELLKSEAMLTGKRNGPDGARWYHCERPGKQTSAAPGIIDFGKRLPAEKDLNGKQFFYACATLQSPSECRKLNLLIGSSGQIKIWINGMVVYSYEHKDRELKPDMDKVEGIVLQQGYNRIVVKISDTAKDKHNHRHFSLRFTGATGKPTIIR